MIDDKVRASHSTAVDWVKLRAALAQAVRRQCPGWLSQHADDLAQAALVKIMGRLQTGEGDRPLSSFYLYRVAHRDRKSVV